MSRCAKLVGRTLVGAATVAAASYAAYAGITWYRYGRPSRYGNQDGPDSLLDLYMPEYEVAERHHIRVFAPAETTFATACQMDMLRSAAIRFLIKTRELALRCVAEATGLGFPIREQIGQEKEAPQKGLVNELTTKGWGVLAEIPGREIVLGTVTQPWVAETGFRALPAAEFADFHEPGYVKIAVTLCADQLSPSQSTARTETRVTTTDPAARAKFRRYWSLVSPGAILIRKILLRNLKAEAESQALESAPLWEGSIQPSPH